MRAKGAARCAASVAMCATADLTIAELRGIVARAVEPHRDRGLKHAWHMAARQLGITARRVRAYLNGEVRWRWRNSGLRPAWPPFAPASPSSGGMMIRRSAAALARALRDWHVWRAERHAELAERWRHRWRRLRRRA